MDDAAGLQIATRLKAQTSGMAVAMRNTQNSTSMLQTAEGALDEVSNMLVRMKDLATQAADASSTGASNANTTIGNLQKAIEAVSTVRSEMGAAANRLNHVYNNLSNISTNSKAATGRIMDVDFASESSKMTTNQMLLQAGTAMLKQSNSMSSMVMSLLQ